MKIRLIVFYLIMLVLISIPIEFLSYYVCENIFIPRGLVFKEQVVQEKEFNEYIENRIPILGWVCAKKQCPELDEIGSRKIPSFPNPGKYPACVSAYGDSYTFSNRTSPENSWCNKLSGLLKCRVSNFGVSGYGTDQAFLRYKFNKSDSARIVLLNHFVFDIMRNVNQNWGIRFSVDNQKFGLKPRFILDENNVLKLIDLPDLSFEEIKEMQSNPGKILKHEYYIPGGHYGSQRMEFPYTFCLIKTLLFHSKFKSLYANEPVHMAFYKNSHPTNSLRLTFEIMKAFVKTAENRGQIPIVHIIPFVEDIEYFNAHHVWPYQDLLELLEAEKIDFINSGEKIVENKNLNDFNDLYAGEGHFNAFGDSVLADILYEKIVKVSN